MRQHRQRVALHLPVGLFTIGAFWVWWPLGLAFLGTFLFYEAIEEWRMADHSHLDLEGYLWGLALGIGAWGIIKLIR